MARVIEGGKWNMTGEQIRKARLVAGLNQKQLSERLETMGVYVCRGSLSRVERGERTVSDIELDAISKVLGVPLDVLFGRK